MRILWYSRKHMDISLDRSTWVEMVRALSVKNQVRLVTGYRERRDDLGLGGAVEYVPSIGVPVLNLLSFSTLVALRMPRDVASLDADLVILDPSLVPAALPAILWSRILRSRRVFVVDVRTLPIDTSSGRDRYDRLWFWMSLRLARRLLDGMTAISPSMAQVVAHATGQAVDSIGIWTSGVDMRRFDPAVCARPPGGDDNICLLYHGALLATRGLVQAIEAVALLRDRGESFRLRIVGTGRDEGLLRNRVAELGLESLVSVEGPVSQDDVPALICDADIGLVPFPDLECWRVSSPLKLIEYMAMGIPVIATDLSCNVATAAGSQGVVWAVDSKPDALAAAMSESRRSLASLKVAAQASRGAVAAEYSWDAQAQRMVDFGTRLLREKHG